MESLKLGDHSESTGLLGFLTQGVIGSEIFLSKIASSQESSTTYLKDLRKRVHAAKYWRLVTYLIFALCLKTLLPAQHAVLLSSSLSLTTLGLVWLKFKRGLAGVLALLAAVAALIYSLN